MPFIDIATRKGMEAFEQGTKKGLREAILIGCELKFGSVPESFTEELNAIHDADLLRKILRAGNSAQSLEELRKLWQMG